MVAQLAAMSHLFVCYRTMVHANVTVHILRGIDLLRSLLFPSDGWIEYPSKLLQVGKDPCGQSPHFFNAQPLLFLRKISKQILPGQTVSLLPAR
jgi:hypothetical protein